MNSNTNSSDLFTSTKNQILKQKYQYMTMYLAQTQSRLANIQNVNDELRNKIGHLEHQIQDSNNHQKAEINSYARRYKQQEKQKMQKIQQLKRLISEYKYLCQESMRYTGMQSNRDLSSNKMKISHQKMLQSSRQNSLLYILDSSQNDNNNTSISRNKSYQKIKTKIYCNKCQLEYKPNEYYRHFEECVGQSISSSMLLQVNTKGLTQKSSKMGFKTMRN